MPKLKGPELGATRANKKRFELLTARMTEHGKINANWVGVSNMEDLRTTAHSKGQLTQITAIETLLKKEISFLSDKTDEYIMHRFRSDPSILGISRSETVLLVLNILEDNRILQLINQGFLTALEANAHVLTLGFTGFALVCKEGERTKKHFYFCHQNSDLMRTRFVDNQPHRSLHWFTLHT